MRGRRWAVMAALVAAGSLSLSAHSTGSPSLAAQPAAGIAYSGALDGATTTARLGSPAAAVWSLSIAWASSAGSAPSRSVVLPSFTAAVAPTRMTWAPPACSAPLGLSSSSADCVASGMSSPSDSSTGARSGRLMSWEAEIAARQSSASTSVTTRGRVSREREG